ncbi:hypothetical protein ACQP1U_06690 [Actinomycetota bacterium]
MTSSPRRVILALLSTTLLIATGTLATASPSAAATPPPGTEPYRLGMWNHDFEWGTAGSGPHYWTRSPARATTGNRVDWIPGRAPFPVYVGAGTQNHITWLWDGVRDGSTGIRSQPMNAYGGRFYAAAGRVQTGRGKPAVLHLEFYGADGRRLGVVGQENASPAAGSVGTVRSRGRAPAGTTRVVLNVTSDRASVGSSYWDGMQIEEYIGPEAYQPRLGTASVLFTANHRIASTTSMRQVIIEGEKYGTQESEVSTTAAGDESADPVYDAVCCTKGESPSHSAQLFGTVVRDAGIYKMWYHVKAAGDPWSVWYAESADGVTWPRGHKVLHDGGLGGVVKNPDTSDPSKRWLMLVVKGTMQMTVTQLPMPPVNVDYRTYASADGETWRPLSNGRALPFRDIASVSWDPVNRQFIALTKQASGVNRQLFVSTSRDFLSWTTPRRALRTDSGDRPESDVYASALFRMGEGLIALPIVYTASLVNGVNGPLQPFLASSRDGVHFSRPTTRAPSLPLGPLGSLDDGMILTASAPVYVGDKVRFYYGAWNGGHEDTPRSARIFFAEWDRDRFAGMRATSTYGSLVTKPLLPTGSALSVNATVPRGGRLTVAVQDAATGRVIPGYEAAASSYVTGDSGAHKVTWGGKSLAGLRGRQVRLRFTMTAGAEIYAFRVQ